MRALLSVYDKTGVVELARVLADAGWDLLSSGGTAKAIAEAGLEVTDVADVTGFPAILGHRVVTLHPKVHGGILADRSDAEHRAEMDQYGIEGIDLVVVNLYPFSSDPSIELIDIGGPAMVRAAAKNHAHVGVVVDPADYDTVAAEITAGGSLSEPTRRRLARTAFEVTAAYDRQVADWLAGEDGPAAGDDERDAALPEQITMTLRREAVLRYGENPHQVGARYATEGASGWWDSAVQHGGKEMSYLNVYDADAAWRLVHCLGDDPAAVVIKHANPCGVAVGATIDEAYQRAHACDPVSAFGGIVAVNRPVTSDMAAALFEVFTEVLIAPGFDDDALLKLLEKRNLRVLEASAPSAPGLGLRAVDGGYLVQTPDPVTVDRTAWQVVTEVQPTEAQWRDVELAWRVVARVTSNAIVLVAGGAAVGIGAGQQNRRDAGRIACEKADGRATGGVYASDAFFPFADGLDGAVEAGAAVVVQPGGSVRDEEVIARAEAEGLAMVFTGERHFRH
ncbi:MAG: bifunctional phosphoribosylaminoimidazolecarboxamide formyltransferase/IMP cyclohydrolase [Acidimicrobiia bacterium]|nr:bifunctional phosphoribosylaminoimidazolecarboxamide formyltransferase/IMP cyclohydrolase [Acidimicrobiia bacterium]